MPLVIGQNAAAFVEPAADPVNNDIDNYAYNGALSSQENHTRVLQDHTIAKDDLSITASAALAGAITSIRYKGFELIASGGHGAAAQMALHDWSNGQRLFRKVYDDGAEAYFYTKDRPNECGNPTEAGNTANDLYQAFPYHGPSSSYLAQFGSGIDSQSGNPVIWSENHPVDYTPLNQWSEDSGYGQCLNEEGQWFRGYELHKNIELGFPYAGGQLKNVVRVRYQVKTGRASDHFDAKFVLYLSRYFSNEHRYIRGQGLMVAKPRGFALETRDSDQARFCYNNSTLGKVVPVFSDVTGNMAVAMVMLDKFNNSKVTAAEGYTQTQFDYYAPQYDHRFRNIGQRVVAANVNAGEWFNHETILVFGSLAELPGKIEAICSVERCQSHWSDYLGLDVFHSEIFNAHEYLELNPDLFASGINTHSKAASHWMQHGLREGRQGSKAFWSAAYLARNPDIHHAFAGQTVDYCGAIKHWIQYGKGEGREK